MRSGVEKPKSSMERAIEREMEIEELRKKEWEEERAARAEELVSKLHDATGSWKETGEIDVSLEVPVTWKDQVKKAWKKLAKKLPRPKVKKERGPLPDVEDEWREVIHKAEQKQDQSRRDIENIYKQLTTKE